MRINSPVSFAKIRWDYEPVSSLSRQTIAGRSSRSLGEWRCHRERARVRENGSNEELKPRVKKTYGSRHGYLEVDLAVALVILTLAIVPLGFSFAHEQKALRADYSRAIVNELVDGEMEILAAGDWKEFPDGSHAYTVHSHAAKNLPAGHFELTKTGNHLRLEWTPDGHAGVGAVVRDMTVK